MRRLLTTTALAIAPAASAAVRVALLATGTRPELDPNRAHVEQYQQNVRRVDNARMPAAR